MKKIKKIFITFFIILFLFACSSSKEFYKHNNSGKGKIIETGETR